MSNKPLILNKEVCSIIHAGAAVNLGDSLVIEYDGYGGQYHGHAFFVWFEDECIGCVYAYGNGRANYELEIHNQPHSESTKKIISKMTEIFEPE